LPWNLAIRKSRSCFAQRLLSNRLRKPFCSRPFWSRRDEPSPATVVKSPYHSLTLRRGFELEMRLPPTHRDESALPGCPILVRSVRKGGIPPRSNPRDFDRPMPCQTPTAPTSVESHPNVEERDVRMGHPALAQRKRCRDCRSQESQDPVRE